MYAKEKQYQENLERKLRSTYILARPKQQVTKNKTEGECPKGLQTQKKRSKSNDTAYIHVRSTKAKRDMNIRIDKLGKIKYDNILSPMGDGLELH